MVMINLGIVDDRAPKKPLDGVRVLLVDDSPDNQVLIGRMLTRLGGSVIFSDNGSRGCERALSADVDVVLMDIEMPVMDGYGAMATLVESKYHRPVIALTAHAKDEDRQRTKNAGFASHVTKPIEFSVLTETICNVLGHYNAQY